MRLPLPTARLTFRAWREDDPLAPQLFGDARVSALVGGPFDAHQIRERLAFELTNQRDSEIAYWPIREGDVDVGCCGLKPRDPARNILELGFYLLPAHWGQGYAVEAGRSVIAHAFDVLGVPELFAGHHPDNHASRKTLEKLGFVYTHDELYPPTGNMNPGYALRK